MRSSVLLGSAVVCCFCLFFCSSLAHAAINPIDPGLPDAKAYGEEAITNNGLSAMCVECHTANPRPGTATHFVLNNHGGPLRRTNSGGGWAEGYWGVRDGGQFFKISVWDKVLGGSGGYSKYGDVEKWQSVIFNAEGSGQALQNARFETQAGLFAGYELICESCHSLKFNVEGRYNLLSRVVESDLVDERLNGAKADLCIGCHGFLYHDDQGAANSINTNWSDLRNISEITAAPRGNNEVHYISGQRYPRNHHVMSGDAIDFPVVQAGLTLRDVRVLSPSLVSNPIRTDSGKGTARVRTVALPPMVLPTNPAYLNCVTCHASAHGGEPSMGAAILKGLNLRGKDTGFGIDRISDGKTWGRYYDTGFCGMCHE